MNNTTEIYDSEYQVFADDIYINCPPSCNAMVRISYNTSDKSLDYYKDIYVQFSTIFNYTDSYLQSVLNANNIDLIVRNRVLFEVMDDDDLVYHGNCRLYILNYIDYVNLKND